MIETQALKDYQKEWIQAVYDYYPQARNNVENGVYSYFCCTYYKDKDMIQVPMGELAIRLHTIEAVVLEKFPYNQDAATTTLIVNKKIELLRLMVKVGWITEEFNEDVTNFSANFTYVLKMVLRGKNVEDVDNILKFAKNLFILKGILKSNNIQTSFNSTISNIMPDALRLWVSALRSLHPGLSFWNDMGNLMLPINPNAWPIRIPGWLKKKTVAQTRVLKNYRDKLDELNVYYTAGETRKEMLKETPSGDFKN